MTSTVSLHFVTLYFVIVITVLNPKQIPTTGRKSSFQIQQWGYKDLRELAGALPKDAIIIDVGAGLSKLGEDVAELRSDITWINADPCYADDFKTVTKVNLHYIPESILNPGPQLRKKAGLADIVYSYWMLPHLSLQHDDQAKDALRNMASLLNDDGLLIVGPVKQIGLGVFSPFRYKGTVKYNKKELSEGVIQSIVSKTKLWWIPRKIQYFSNKHDIHLLKRFVGGSSKTT